MSVRIPGMPMVPGSLFREVARSYYPRPQALMTFQGINMLNDRRQVPTSTAPKSGAVIDVNCPPIEAASIYPHKTGSRLPPWVVYDKQALCFSAYYKQTLQEVYHAPYQVRKVKIYFFLEDDTLQITEPKTENSGLVQGCMLHRQRVPRPPPCDNEFMSMLDLNVDLTVRIFDRIYHIYDCDKFTRHFLNTRGIAVPDPVPEPDDPYTAMQARKGQVVRQFAPPEKKFPFEQFLKFDKQILKFYAYWDDHSEFGDVRKLEICYYLADDTIDIKEQPERNSGREGPTTFLKRSRLPREFEGLQTPGQNAPFTVLNVLGSNMRDVRYCLDPLNTGASNVLYYSDRDLLIGAVLNVYGRSVVLADCDAFTKDYYRKKYGINDFTPVQIPKRSSEDEDCQPKHFKLPPYNGWGTYEDSIGNCISIEPKAPQTDFRKFVKYDRYVLRYGAKMLSSIKENCERIFVISYYLSDDTVQIFEIAVRNSGFLGGEFMKRTRLRLPGQEKFSSIAPVYYSAVNFFIGSTISLRDFLFHITSADEYTMLYTENNPQDFPFANIKLIMEKVRKSLAGRMRDFITKCGVGPPNVVNSPNIFIGFESIKGALIALMGDDISNHEIITICRYYSSVKPPDSICDRDRVQSAAQLEIKRSLWNAHDELIEHFHHINPTNKPFISESKLRSAIRGCRLPFSKELVDNILRVINRNECDEYELCDFLNFIDVACGKQCEISPMNYAFELCPKIPFLSRGHKLNFSCFLSDLGLDVQDAGATAAEMPRMSLGN